MKPSKPALYSKNSINRLQSKQAIPLFIALVSLITFSQTVNAQTDTSISVSDSAGIIETLNSKDFNLHSVSDSVKRNDSITTSTISKDAIESKITYKARDTIKYDFINQKVFLYGAAVVTYEDIELQAEYIELKMDSNLVFAIGVKDSTGKVVGSPVFKEGGTEYKSQSMTYNFKTEKGIIKEVITQDGEGYVHGEAVKKNPDDVVYIQNGLYTTCDEGHPHFSIWAKQLKIIPNDKIIVKPANLIIEDVNTPILVPFGIFPNKKGGKSGILVPMPGESERDGFYLFNAGYYFYMGEKADLEIEADIYSKGSYAVRPTFNYRKRYKRSGWVKIRHKNTVTGVIPEDPNYSEVKDYWLDWNHRQENNARPNSNFSAAVNLGTQTSFNNDLNTPDQDFLRGNFTSKISYTKYMLQRKLNFSVNARQNQNNTNGVMNVSLPEFNLNMQRMFPFKSKNSVTSKWYDQIGISYNGNFKNDLSLQTDSVTLSVENFDTIANTFRNGVQHSIPIGTNIKMMKHFTLNPSINYNEVWYFNSKEKTMDPNDTNYTVQEITNDGFVRGGNVTASANLTTKVYGMLQFKKGLVRAFRHVITPSIGLSYTPENKTGIKTYKDYRDSIPKEVEYSIFEDGVYGRPDRNASGKLNLGLLNSFEMKVRSRSDTGDGTTKIKLLENLRFGTGYDFIKDSLQWDNISINGNSNITNNLGVLVGGALDLYAFKEDSTGSLYRSSAFEYTENQRLGNLRSGNIGLNFNISGGKGKKDQKKENPEENDEYQNENEEEYMDNQSIRREYAQVDWDIPWSLSVVFQLGYQKNLVSGKLEDNITTTTTANGDLSITKNWRLTYNIYFDTKELKVSYARLGITRNLHCWQMTMDWVPIGDRQSYSFNIGVRANILSDLKLDKRSF